MTTLPPNTPLPTWLARTIQIGFVMVVISIVALAIGLAGGVANPQPVGELQWEDDFDQYLSRWRPYVGGELLSGPAAALTFTSTQPGDWLLLQRSLSVSEYTFEVAGSQPSGPDGAGYGLAFGVQNAEDYSAVIISNTGYIHTYRQQGRERVDIWPQQPWPHILRGEQANRVRVTVRNGMAEIRINDEHFLSVAAPAGDVGVLAITYESGQVLRFGWAKFWSR